MAAKKKGPSNNPLTRQAPNTYTASENQTLEAPKKPRKTVATPSLTRKENSRRAEFEAAGGGRPEIGYNKPEGMSHSDFYWMMGQHQDRGPAVPNINAPHHSDPYAIVNRRAEDLSGEEYRRGKELLHKHGTSVETMRNDIGNSMDRAVASSVKAGAPAPAGQLFYGGKDPHGEESVPVHHLEDSVNRLVASKHFPRTGNDHADRHLAHAMMTVANSKTSPNVPFIAEHKDFGQYSPNNMAAEAAVHAALEGKNAPTGKAIGGFLRKRGANVPKVGVGVYGTNMRAAVHATSNLAMGVTTSELRHESGSPMFRPTEAPKTTDYQAAHQAPEGPDAKTVVDVHEGGNAFPHLGYLKSHTYEAIDHAGNTMKFGGEKDDETGEQITGGKRAKVDVHPDEYGPNGELPHRMKALLPHGASGWARSIVSRGDDEDPDKTKGEWGKSRVEGVLSEGKNIINAMVDRAAREVHAERGMSPGVDSAQFVHRGQASRWTQRQIDRPDMKQSIESEYGLPMHHEHMWSSAAQLHDEQQQRHGHSSLYDAVEESDYHVPHGHPWAGITAPHETENHDDGSHESTTPAYKPTPKRAPDPVLRAAYVARGGKP